MTELQKVEYALLGEFIKVCEKLGLRYYLVCGTALGAVKYKGFIPWDDDIDVALSREDYRVFCKKAQELLPEHVFLQTYETDPAFPAFYCKLRNSETAYIEKSVKGIPMNQGVYIDVFPLDGYPASKKEAARLERRKRILKLMLDCAFEATPDTSLKARLIFKAERALGLHKKTAKTAKKLEELISAYPVEDSALWCNHGNWQGALEYAPREHYGEGALANFEGLQVRVPEAYDEYLTQKYGDWRADPDEKEQVGHHYYEVCDLERSYKEYVNIKNI
ncbi:MAG: LicD family protein [Clostridia bacterium]|nr:LicD family protein [Clostridia bacterium]